MAVCVRLSVLCTDIRSTVQNNPVTGTGARTGTAQQQQTTQNRTNSHHEASLKMLFVCLYVLCVCVCCYE